MVTKNKADKLEVAVIVKKKRISVFNKHHTAYILKIDFQENHVHVSMDRKTSSTKISTCIIFSMILK